MPRILYLSALNRQIGPFHQEGHEVFVWKKTLIKIKDSIKVFHVGKENCQFQCDEQALFLEGQVPPKASK